MKKYVTINTYLDNNLNYVNKNIIKFLAKITTISVLFVVIFNVWLAFFDKEAWKKSTSKENKHNYVKTTDTILSSAWVAISTNLWIRYKERSEIPATIYKDVMSVWEIIKNKGEADDNLITKNMLQIKDYLNVMRTDVKGLINKSHDKPLTLKAFISEIEYRYKNAAVSMKALEQQRWILETAIIKNDEKINSLRAKINIDFSGSNTVKTLENIDTYLELKKEYNYSKVYIIFINQFIRQYNYLNSYNKTLLDTLINNREAIIKDAYIVIPDSGTELLEQMNIIQSEADFKGR